MSDKTVLVMIGLDHNGKPHAARFAAKHAETAAQAADTMGYHLVSISDADTLPLAEALPEGKLWETGKAFVPFTAKATFEALAARVEGEITPAPKSPNAKPPKPKKVSAPEPGSIEVGSVVLAYSSDDECWFEAIVLGIGKEGASLKLRWQDYPDEGSFTARTDRVAMLPAACR